jgi:hypothetical protein
MTIHKRRVEGRCEGRRIKTLRFWADFQPNGVVGLWGWGWIDGGIPTATINEG